MVYSAQGILLIPGAIALRLTVANDIARKVML